MDLTHFIVFMISLIFSAIGIKTIVTRKITIYTSFRTYSSPDFPEDNRGSWAKSELSGFVAVLIGIAYIVLGVGLWVKGPAFFQ